MITITLKIREKDFSSDPGSMWDVTKYTDTGLYKVYDGTTYYLVYVGKYDNTEGSADLVYSSCTWDRFEESMGNKILQEVSSSDNSSVETPQSKGVSEDFALNLVSVLTNGRKL